ncbi:hypothetical protein F2P81_012346 [Scophthalmus maximus]|uniref:Uncharacterized protein n=1 Tax=Scophthalmus maximus TaxID=52904 RepID=A0A6A4SR42_SCOMX|nr:hypothetical protein F2P81_012346 [Scophthalmus maximus]
MHMETDRVTGSSHIQSSAHFLLNQFDCFFRDASTAQQSRNVRQIFPATADLQWNKQQDILKMIKSRSSREANEVQYNGSQLFIFDPMLIMMQNRESSGSSGSSSVAIVYYNTPLDEASICQASVSPEAHSHADVSDAGADFYWAEIAHCLKDLSFVEKHTWGKFHHFMNAEEGPTEHVQKGAAADRLYGVSLGTADQCIVTQKPHRGALGRCMSCSAPLPPPPPLLPLSLDLIRLYDSLRDSNWLPERERGRARPQLHRCITVICDSLIPLFFSIMSTMEPPCPDISVAEVM